MEPILKFPKVNFSLRLRLRNYPLNEKFGFFLPNPNIPSHAQIPVFIIMTTFTVEQLNTGGREGNPARIIFSEELKEKKYCLHNWALY